jgi:hypothetical protein
LSGRHYHRLYANRSADRWVASVNRCRVASFLAALLRRSGRADWPSHSIEVDE